jgi:hypothetical protein
MKIDGETPMTYQVIVYCHRSPNTGRTEPRSFIIEARDYDHAITQAMALAGKSEWSMYSY